MHLHHMLRIKSSDARVLSPVQLGSVAFEVDEVDSDAYWLLFQDTGKATSSSRAATKPMGAYAMFVKHFSRERAIAVARGDDEAASGPSLLEACAIQWRKMSAEERDVSRRLASASSCFYVADMLC